MSGVERIIHLYSEKALELSRRLEEDMTALVGPQHPPVFFSPLKDGLLGLYDSASGAIFISDALISHPYETIVQISRHELAHWRNHIENGSLEHDASFRAWCGRLGCDEDYSRAKVEIGQRAGIVDKVRKLRALSSSPFEAESQAALRKVRQLVAEYSLENEGDVDGGSICWCDLYSSPRKIPSSRQRLCQMAALQTGVYLVQVRTASGVCIRAYGRRGELEVASYLVDVLHGAIEGELRRRRAKEPGRYYGITGTNSFYDGVYSALQQRRQTESADEVGTALAVVERDNERLTRSLVFRDTRLVTRHSRHRYDPDVYENGRSFGRSLRIRKGVCDDGTATGLLPGG